MCGFDSLPGHLNANGKTTEMMETIRGICRFGGRWPGTNAEREAANFLAGRLRAMGRDVDVEAIRVRPDFGIVHAIHAMLAIVGSVVSVYSAPFGVVILLFTLVSTFGDLTTRFYLVRRLMPSRASQNVYSAQNKPDAKATLVLCAHHDSGRSGMAFRMGSGRIAKLFARRFNTSLAPFAPIFGSMVVLLALAALRTVGVESTSLTAVQFAFTVLLLISIPLQIDVALADPAPGANDNASGVAVGLELLKRFEESELKNLNVSVLFPGAEEGMMLGIREWIKAHDSELDTESTYFLNIDTVGYGTPHYVTKEGFIFMFDFDSRLVEICDSIAEADIEGDGQLRARPYKFRLGSDGLVPMLAGYPAITVVSLDEGVLPNYRQLLDTPENIDPAALERSADFTEQIATELDQLVE